MSDYIERYWRDATPQDAIKEPPMVARFRDDGDNGWLATDILLYYDRSMHPWHNNDGISYEHCQVYDAPDPGEGWKLIDPNTETLREGDGLMVSSHRESGWVEIQVRPNSWSERDFYRRRIEPPKPEPRYEPFRWEDREQLRGRWVQCAGIPCGEWMITTMYIGSHGELRVNSIDADRLRTGYVFADTGEPVGRKVE